MAVEKKALRDWHRLFGLLLTDFFSGSPFSVELELDLSKQQQMLDVLIVRRKPGKFVGRLPDGLEDLTEHNLITFKSHREALDDWTLRELGAHYVAYRKFVSPSPSALLPEDRFRLYAVAARFPQNLSRRLPWQERQQGVYDCLWGLDEVRVVVAGELAKEAHNAPLQLFSASPELLGFASGAYRRRSQVTSALLGQLFEGFQAEGLAMPYTIKDFQRDYIIEHFPRLTPEEGRKALQSVPAKQRRKILKSLPLEERREILESLPPEERREILESLPPEGRREILESLPPEGRREILRSLSPEDRREILRSLPPEERLAGLSAEQIRRYLNRQTRRRPSGTRKPHRKD